jgi:hypothetical protein
LRQLCRRASAEVVNTAVVSGGEFWRIGQRRSAYVAQSLSPRLPAFRLGVRARRKSLPTCSRPRHWWPRRMADRGVAPFSLNRTRVLIRHARVRSESLRRGGSSRSQSADRGRVSLMVCCGSVGLVGERTPRMVRTRTRAQTDVNGGSRLMIFVWRTDSSFDLSLAVNGGCTTTSFKAKLTHRPSRGSNWLRRPRPSRLSLDPSQPAYPGEEWRPWIANATSRSMLR